MGKNSIMAMAKIFYPRLFFFLNISLKGGRGGFGSKLAYIVQFLKILFFFTFSHIKKGQGLNYKEAF